MNKIDVIQLMTDSPYIITYSVHIHVTAAVVKLL